MGGICLATFAGKHPPSAASYGRRLLLQQHRPAPDRGRTPTLGPSTPASPSLHCLVRGLPASRSGAACPGSRRPRRGFTHGDARQSPLLLFGLFSPSEYVMLQGGRILKGWVWAVAPGGFHGGQWMQIRPGSPTAPWSLHVAPKSMPAVDLKQSRLLLAQGAGSCWAVRGFSAHMEASLHWSQALWEVLRDKMSFLKFLGTERGCPKMFFILEMMALLLSSWSFAQSHFSFWLPP